MTLRVRLALAATLAAAVAIVGVAVLGVVITRHQLRAQVDSSLHHQADTIAQSQLLVRPGRFGPSIDQALQLSGGTVPFQVIDGDGDVLLGVSPYVRALPVDLLDRQVATGQRHSVLRDITIDHQHFRQATVPSVTGLAVQAIRPLDDIDRTVRDLTLALTLVALGGIGLAGGLGVFVARRALRPVAALSAAAQEVAARQDPAMSVPVSGGAELALLGTSINTMLAALDDARQQQRRLIDDAAHELRTPLTSLRTNIEVLAGGRLTLDEDRVALLADLNAQLEEFSNLVGDLDHLARGELVDSEPAPVAFGAVVGSAVRRARRRAGTVELRVIERAPGIVTANASLLERAVLNVLDNAVKWSPPGAPVEVVLEGTVLTITDHGPGIPPTEAELVFERFWRSPSARAMPGSGLGLSIVRQVVTGHHGTVTIHTAPGGGTVVRLALPTATAGPTSPGLTPPGLAPAGPPSSSTSPLTPPRL